MTFYFPEQGKAITVTFYKDNYSVGSATYNYGEEALLIGGTTASSEIRLQAINKQSVTLKVCAVPAWPTTKTFRTYIHFDEVYIKPVAPGELESSDIKVTLDAPSTSGFSSGSVTVGRLLTFGGSTITADSPTNITEDGGKIADITLKEEVAGALKKNDADFLQKNTVKLVLSPGFSWDNVTLIPLGGFSKDSVAFAVHTERDGRSALYLKINNESSGSPGQLVIKASIKVDEPLTTSRDVKVTYGGTNPGVGGERIAEVTVAKYLVPGLTVTAKSALDVVAGRSNQQIGSFTIAEGMPGDLPQGRLISLTLPEGAKWNQVPQVSLEAGSGVLEFRGTRDEGRTVTFVVKAASSERAVFCFKNATVDLALGAPEELTVTVKGPGVSSTVTVAHVQAPVAVSAAGSTVRIGVQEQPVGTITIQENLVGALRTRDAAGNRAVLKLTLPSGVRFARIPTVKVTAGDLELDATGIKLDDNDRTLVIPVKLSSATPVEKQAGEQVGSTLAVEDILLTVERAVPEGDITLEVSGSALSETEDLFSPSLNKLTCVLARCITPAPEEIKRKVVFTVGSTRYQVGSEEREMDVAPYIKEGRIYAPVRYLAYAVGLTEERIFWNSEDFTVTLLTGKRVVQFKVGQRGYVLQGIYVPMDAAPEIVNGRVMVPYRYLAQALGFQVSWDPVKQAIIIQ
ncbi:copper amine oxidase N-terminal domain-containing protein [Ammonifex degensii]|nr:copper amine oxidase N-terminal domain-containing protein [Ammonifex degensii]